MVPKIEEWGWHFTTFTPPPGSATVCLTLLYFLGHFPYLPALFYHGSHYLVDSAASVTWNLMTCPGSPLFQCEWAFSRPLAQFPTPTRSPLTDQHLSRHINAARKFAISKSDKSFSQFFFLWCVKRGNSISIWCEAWLYLVLFMR